MTALTASVYFCILNNCVDLETRTAAACLVADGVDDPVVLYIANAHPTALDAAADHARYEIYLRLKKEYGDDRDELDTEKELRVAAFRRALYEGLLEIGPDGIDIAGWDDSDPYSHASFTLDQL